MQVDSSVPLYYVCTACWDIFMCPDLVQNFLLFFWFLPNWQ